MGAVAKDINLADFIGAGGKFDPRANMRQRRQYILKNNWVEKYIYPRDPDEPEEDQTGQKEEVLNKIATFTLGSTRRSKIQLTDYVTGVSFLHHELQHFEAREAVIRKQLERIGIPESVLVFNPPTAPMPPPVFHGEDVSEGTTGKLGDEWNEQALAGYKKMMSAVHKYAHENPGGAPQLGSVPGEKHKGMNAVNRAMANAMTIVMEKSKEAHKRTLKVPSDWHYPDADERKKMFQDADKNGNGKLSLAEIDLAIKVKWPSFNHKPAIIRAYKLADSATHGRQDGYIQRSDDEDRCEWSHFVKYLVLYNDYWHRFSELDVDGDRRITLDEWTIRARRFFGDEVEGLSDDNLVEIYQAMDADGTGVVLFDEFCAWAAKLFGDKQISAASAERLEDVEAGAWNPNRMATFHQARQAKVWQRAQQESINQTWSPGDSLRRQSGRGSTRRGTGSGKRASANAGPMPPPPVDDIL